ncbi:hypothetical protein EJ02DRAFT_513099 [Clathrospora elynae]|uniref:LysM domain-containing protein n=1 Tax=Clathrospora elynae TaxID=706981 RepID=A0A6A5SLF5_9PLEO|nr:hypothetical protein EJ02DRAFT_513099 [Clathrospora elynae]
MARSLLFILGAMLTLLFDIAHANPKEMLRMYGFSSDTCDNMPILGNFDVYLGSCFNIAGGCRSITPFSHKNLDWIENLNRGAFAFCTVYTFTEFGCLPVHLNGAHDVPMNIGECLTPWYENSPMRSVQFLCGEEPRDILRPATIHTTYTAAVPITSWKQGADSKFTPHVSTKTATIRTVIVSPNPLVSVTEVSSTITIRSTTTVFTATPLPKTILSRSELSLEPAETNRLVKRAKWNGPRKGVWMRHPWSMSLTCFECYTKSDDNISKFECRAGPDNIIDCGPEPDLRVKTITVHATITTTIYPGHTMVPHIGKRGSWHRAVVFNNPFQAGTKVCADAEWEKRGHDKTEIRLQKPKTNLKKCKDADEIAYIQPNQPIVTVAGLPVTTTVTAPPVFTTFVLPTSTVISGPITITTTVPIAPTVMAAVENQPPHPDL